jgi:hypothetical protein
LFWTVEAFVATSHFRQLRRDETERANIRISPTCLMRLHVNVIEIPEGSWGAAGQNIDTVKISKLIGATERPERLEGALGLGREDESGPASVSRNTQRDWTAHGRELRL